MVHANSFTPKLLGLKLRFAVLNEATDTKLYLKHSLVSNSKFHLPDLTVNLFSPTGGRPRGCTAGVSRLGRARLGAAAVCVPSTERPELPGRSSPHHELHCCLHPPL